ncbi:MAG: M1 family metallopeptidase [Anaerolineae bacterium]|nr:M1 family metallopeptidase [Anaerolineae bacterium]
MRQRTLLIPAIALLLVSCILAAPGRTPTGAPTGKPDGAVQPVAPTATPAPTTAPTATPTVPPAPTPTAAQRAPALPPWAGETLPYRQAMRPGFAGDVDDMGEATRYAIELDVDLEGLTYAGQAWVWYTNREEGRLNEIVFRLLPNTPGYGGEMRVTRVAVDGAGVSPELRLGNSALYVPLSTPLAPGEQIAVYIAFRGVVPTDSAAGYAQYGYYDQVLALPNAYPMIPVYDDEGWNVELAPTYGDATFTDTALYAIRVTLPADLALVASGVVVDEIDNGDGTTTHTVVSGPMRDWTMVASAAFEAQTTQVDDIIVRSTYRAGDDEGGTRALDYAARSLDIYQELIGPYPFNELDVVATPTRAGGIEYPGLVVIAQSMYGSAGGFFELATVHEVAHQWWYSLIGNDQLDEPWLDEALTQYTSMLYYEQRYGPEAAALVRATYFEAPYEQLAPEDQALAVGMPVAAYGEGLYGPIVYGKGPLFFHALRARVGDSTFYRILQAYADDHAYQIAYPRDLVATVEQVSGAAIDDLYQEWILGADR